MCKLSQASQATGINPVAMSYHYPGTAGWHFNLFFHMGLPIQLLQCPHSDQMESIPRVCTSSMFVKRVPGELIH